MSISYIYHVLESIAGLHLDYVISRKHMYTGYYVCSLWSSNSEKEATSSLRYYCRWWFVRLALKALICGQSDKGMALQTWEVGAVRRRKIFFL